jgi:hypothetical protein
MKGACVSGVKNKPIFAAQFFASMAKGCIEK